MEVALAIAVEVIVRGWIGAVTERLNVAFAVTAGALESVTFTVMGKLPVAVGVPERIPLLAREIPAGSPAADQV